MGSVSCTMEGYYGLQHKAFHPSDFARKPIVAIRISAVVCSIIVFGSISSQGWQYHQDKAKEICIINMSSTACNLGTWVGVLAFLVALGFWSVSYLLTFSTVAHQWSASTEPPAGYGHRNISAAIFFSFSSIFLWAGCSLISWQRYKAGYEEGGESLVTPGGAPGNYSSPGGGYQNYSQDAHTFKPPFSEQGGAAPGYQEVHY